VGGETFHTCPEGALRSTKPPVEWLPGLSTGGKGGPGRGADPTPTSSDVVKKE